MDESRPSAAQKANWPVTLARLLALLVVIGITVGVYLLRDKIEHFAVYGYPGIFLITVLAYATVLIPVPGLAIVFAMSGVLHPAGVAVAAAAGAAIGELSGYLAGYSGRAVIENWKRYERITAWVRKHGGPAIAVLAAIPNPAFDLVGVAAGVLKMPVHKFLSWAFAGQLIKMLVIAYGGSVSLGWILK
ncbi:MAG: VTT domain-containing protein [Anaerolineales bacterium]